MFLKENDIDADCINKVKEGSLAVRMPGSITEEKIKILQDVDYLYISMLKKSGFYDKIWQAINILLLRLPKHSSWLKNSSFI